LHNADLFIFNVLSSAILVDIIHLNKYYIILILLFIITFDEHITITPTNSLLYMSFSEKITKLKKQKKMSQIELAKITGISRDAISKYERGDVTPSVEYAKRIADALGVTIDYLVNDSDLEDVLDNEAVKRIKEIQLLPELEKDKILSVIDALIRDTKAKQAFGLNG
jgi:transcriptional regulator with XRE-family HTH domain